MKRIKTKELTVSILLMVLLIVSCRQINVEPKYREHKTYSEFLDFLRKGTDTMSSDFDKTSYIRKKTAELIDGGFGIHDAQILDKSWPSWTGERYYNVFFKDSATVYCGGSAHFLNRIYEDLGYKATTYDMGYDSASHQLTLVWNKEIHDYIVQDAYLNISLKNKNNQALSFKELISLLSEYRCNEITVIQDGYDYIPNWDTSGVLVLYTNFAHQYVEENFDSAYNNFIGKFCSIDNHDSNTLFYERNYDDMVLGWMFANGYGLSKHNLPDDWLYLFLLPKEHNDKDINLLVEKYKLK